MSDENNELPEFEKEYEYIPDNIEINKSSIYDYKDDYLESEDQEEIIKNAKKNNREKTANTLAKILANVKEVFGILGLFEQEPEKFLTEMKQKYVAKLDISEEEISKLIDKRSEAKKEKDFETADAIRSELDGKGIILNDTINGTIWNVKSLFNIE